LGKPKNRLLEGIFEGQVKRLQVIVDEVVEIENSAEVRIC
jgi:hypothetical protein